MNDERPTPEQMLARVKTEGEPERTNAPRGRLRLFFGYAAGVGKTYAMLRAAQVLRKEGRDVVVGYVEPHGLAGNGNAIGGAGLPAIAFGSLPWHDASRIRPGRSPGRADQR